MNKKAFHIEERIDGLFTNYKFSYHSTEKEVSNSTLYYIEKQFQTKSSQLNQNDFEEYGIEIREYYDEWRQSGLNKILRRLVVATTIGLSVKALTTGLSIGLKRSGNDIINANYKP